MKPLREAIILAGGFGTRLSHVIADLPKPMAPVAGRPFLRFILDQLSDAKFDHVIIADGYKREAIETYFGNRYRGMELTYSPEEKPLLTGGATKKALLQSGGEWVFVLNGDTYCDVDFDAMESRTNDESASCIMAAKPMRHSDRYGSIRVSDEGTVLSFEEKRSSQGGMINAGVYLLRARSLKTMPEVFSLEENWLRREVISSRIKAILCDGMFIDIGIPEDYERAQGMLAPLAKHWKLAFFDRDGTINVDTGHLYEPEKLELIPEAVELILRYNKDSAYKVVVVTNQAGIAKGIYSVDQMRSLHRFLDEKLARFAARVDAYYFCPHHPLFTGGCECRKPKPGMMLNAIRDFDSKPEDCVMYGDKAIDLEAARAAGIPRLTKVDF